MKFLLDQSTDARLVAWLTERGHDATRIGGEHPHGLPDEEVLAIARRESRILITDDRDFGELVFRHYQPHTGHLPSPRLLQLHTHHIAVRGCADRFRCPARPIFGCHSRTRAREAQVIFSNMPMLIGYARVSTADQTLALQQDALEKAGCSKIFTDTSSGAKSERKGFDEALSYVRAGDTLVVWRLDRLGRSLRHLIETISELDNRKIGFKSLTENIDTTTSGGKLVFHIFGALAEFERNLIRERTLAGLEASRARGRKGGRPKVLTQKQIAMAQALYDDKTHTIEEICKTLNIGRTTLFRYVKGKRENDKPVS